MKIKRYTYLILFVMVSSMMVSHAQKDSKWDDTVSKDWPKECKVIEIKSTTDQKMQKAYFYKSQGKTPRPLIISLHTWSFNYQQQDSLSWQSIDKNYNYIHPDFRGPNYTYEACGSPLAISDIDDAIAYAIKNGNVDTNEIHVIGVSGGGYATLLTYMNSKYNIKTFSAWAPISNIVEWYYQSEGRKKKYAKHMAMATTGLTFENEDYHLNVEEAKKRSPIFMNTPIEKRKNSKLYIYEGVHDGYTGSVPITHALNIYNKIVKDFDVMENEAIIPTNDIIELVTSRGFTNKGFTKQPDKFIHNRLIHYQKNYKDNVQITMFEGGHEMISDIALNHIDSKSILVIGDSNGEFNQGWVDQLKDLRFKDFIYNTPISGNTIGFDNNGKALLNTLKNIDSYLNKATDKLHKLDAIIIMLGTNDCKKIFKDDMINVPKNLEKLIAKIKSHQLYKKNPPKIIIVSPPPIAQIDLLEDQYKEAGTCLEYLIPKFEAIASKENFSFVNIYNVLENAIDNMTVDGIHLTIESQKIVAQIVNNNI